MPEVDYPIGIAGKPWGPEDRVAWLAQEKVKKIKRSYREEVVSKLELLKDRFDVQVYGALSYDTERYPLFLVKSRTWSPEKPSVLVTGGVHGYETSGVQGAILFLQTKAQDYEEVFNLAVAPCVSPWGYETIQRWNPNADDPNRSFRPGGPAEEASALMKLLPGLNVDQWTCHLDLHETTDSDKLEFRPARGARDGEKTYDDHIPDGFYLVGDSECPQDDFLESIIESVRKVTHIAPPDSNGALLGKPVHSDGVIVLPTKSLGLCGGMTNATFSATTEVYPDSESATEEQCNLAQVTAVTAALEHIKRMNGADAKRQKL
eukprot:TRINITY_DN72951_c0_g1_i1.p1 TRINITY_DN72951_c0_g1~~TRINITY_DN72951_c0_g1_i1.p1  ORF type:complete len:319 (-),score=32.02 TRINITY_DN72951_c0_g1_i1:17-973(-)